MQTAARIFCVVIALSACAESHSTTSSDDAAMRDAATDGSVSDVDAAIGDELAFEELLAELRRARCEHAMHCEPIDAAEASCHPAANGQSDFPFFVLRFHCDGHELNASAAARCLEATREDGCFIAGSDDWLACHDVWGVPPPEGSTCRPWSCGRDQFCDTDGEPWRCRDRARIGGICHVAAPRIRGGSIECAEGLDCVVDRGGGPSTCQPRTLPGDPCEATLTCSFGQSCEDGVCRGYEERLGERCEEHGCVGDLHCVGTSASATCQRGGGAGEACTDNRYCWLDPECPAPPCAAGHRCVEGACVVIRGPGETCARTEDCPFAFHCAGGRCTPDPIAGEPCSDIAPCASGVCQDGVCAMLEEGEACDWRYGDFTDGLGACAVGVCWDGVCPTVIPIGGQCPTMDTLFTHTCERGAECDYASLECAPERDAFCSLRD